MKQFLLTVLIAISISGCSKKDNVPSQPPAPLDDARTVLLKEIVSQSMPAPYFHFVYDSNRYVKQISFADGLTVYNTEYENKRVARMTNIKNNNTLLYSYNNKQVAAINEFSGLTSEKIFSYRFSYNAANQLVQAQWIEYFADSSGNPFKKMTLSYYADGNLESIDQYSISNGQSTWECKKKFSDYDTKANVDDIYLLEDFFDSYLFLPQVKLQHNNPKKQQLIFSQNEFEITYNYQYNGNLPVRKDGIMRQTKGNGNGQIITIADTFTYY